MGQHLTSELIPSMRRSRLVYAWVRRQNAFLISLLLTCGLILPLAPGTGEGAMSVGWVKYQNGKLSMAFDQTPIELVAEAVRVKIGMRMSLPAGSGDKLVSFRVDPFPVEEAMRRLVQALGFENFAMIYDDHGKAQHVIVLGGATKEPKVLAHIQSPITSSAPPQVAMPERPPWVVQENPPLTREQRLRLREIFPPR